MLVFATTQQEDTAAQLYDRYAPMLFRLAASMLRNREDAEDAVQNVFVKFVMQPHLFLSTEHEKAWFVRVTVNQCKDSLRRRSVRRAEVLEDVPEIGVWDHHSETLEAILTLPEEYRTPLVLHYFEDCKIAEIAQALRLGESAVKMRLKRAREMLKEQLSDEEQT